MGIRKQGERGPSRFRMLEVTRAMIAARNAGVEVRRMTIEANGRIILQMGRPDVEGTWDVEVEDRRAKRGDLDQAEEAPAA